MRGRKVGVFCGFGQLKNAINNPKRGRVGGRNGEFVGVVGVIRVLEG